jgi:acylphosphatase
MKAKLRIRGRVQGVFFRETARQQAVDLGLLGWVKNHPDGSVEAWVEGSPEGVRAFMDWSKRGPDGARVEEVQVEDCTETWAFRDFRVLR